MAGTMEKQIGFCVADNSVEAVAVSLRGILTPATIFGSLLIVVPCQSNKSVFCAGFSGLTRTRPT